MLARRKEKRVVEMVRQDLEETSKKAKMKAAQYVVCCCCWAYFIELEIFRLFSDHPAYRKPPSSSVRENKHIS